MKERRNERTNKERSERRKEGRKEIRRKIMLAWNLSLRNFFADVDVDLSMEIPVC